MSAVEFSRHALDRAAEYAVTRAEVEHVVRTGEVIERYSDARPHPSRLILGFSGNRPLHVVAATSADEEEIFIVTLYEPDPNRWESNWKTRKARP